MPNSELNHIYWMGGSPCGGKSSVSKIIAEQFGLKLYSIDEELRRLMKHISPKNQPALSLWESQSWEQRWMQPVDQLLKFVIQAYDEEFQLCIEEIKAIPPSQPTLVEGNPLRPQLVAPLLNKQYHALWLIAKEDDLRHYYRQREWIRDILKETSHPEKAFDHWMERDIAFAKLVREDCKTHHLQYMNSNRQLSIEAKAHQVAIHFQLARDL